MSEDTQKNAYENRKQTNDICPVDIKRCRLKHTNLQEYKADENVMQ